MQINAIKSCDMNFNRSPVVAVGGGANGEKWGKMGKEFYGESILGLAIFPIFPH